MTKKADKEQKVQDVKTMLENPINIARVALMAPDSPEAGILVGEVAAIHPAINSLVTLISFVFTTMPAGSPTEQAFRGLKTRILAAKQLALESGGAVGHYTKRALIRSLGFNSLPKSIGAFLEMQKQLDVGTLLNPLIVWRNRTSPPCKRYTVLADTRCQPGTFVVDKASGFYDVEPDQSRIFLSRDAAGKVTVELAVLRGVAFGSPFTDELYRWLQQVAFIACAERRDVRPGHEGTMVQVGWNAGPRHARVFGLAKSYTAVMDQESAQNHDEDVIAAMTLTWSVCKSLLPTDIMDEIEQSLANAGLPRIATRNVGEGPGYRFEIAGKTYDFPYFERAPSEGFLSQDYSAPSHDDPTYAKWALSWNVGHKVEPHRHSQIPVESQSGIITRSQAQTGPRSAKQENLDPCPKEGGGNFVDLTLKVKVKQAAGTLTAFCPRFLHGTTQLCGAHSAGMTIPFSTRVLDAYNIAKTGTSVESWEGAGNEGN